MSSIGDYNEIMADRDLFNKTVYTPLSEALKLLNERQKDSILINNINKLFKGEIPKVLTDNKCGVIARQIATPNYENRMFLSITKENDLIPVFFEYIDDKFTSNNKYKHSLGQLNIRKYFDKDNNDCMEKITIIDFNKYNGKKLKDIKTFWGESLQDFHKRLFESYNLNGHYFHDESDWYRINNINDIQSAYYNFFLLFTVNGILFENFITTPGTESEFTKKVVLSCLEKVINDTGIKPLIVPIPPMDLETEDFWYSYSPITKKLIPNK